MDFKDYYKILGLEKGADAAAVKKAYRKLAAKYHPDKNQGNKQAEERFKEINEAHEVLGDPEKKNRYDTLGSQWNQMGGQGMDFSDFMRKAGAQGGGRRAHAEDMGDMFGGGQGDFSDFFESLFGGGGRRGGFSSSFHMGQQKGQDFQADIEIDLDEAYHGVKKIIEVGGRQLKLAFKPGIAEGKPLRLPGKGGKGSNGGPDGDFYLNIHIAPHPLFERRGDDLYRDLPVDFLLAVPGGKLEVATLKGPVKVGIPPKAPSGRILRLKGLGMPVYDHPGDFGDLYLKIMLVVPEDLNEQEIEQLGAMAKRRQEKSSV